ncbi:ArfGap-domain-containing protein [Xylariomycetidae sp. FL2044]|nr:ArfGap-domain-containing protein [Xylariomycetidae sp. FL2044]
MSSLMSKRQQARNEKTLQELVQTIPGNSVCADCQARNPAWASWSLGIFLCMRCAAIHRKLGTHISKVKSLSMDSWSNEQVDNMKKVGNVLSNNKYNPQNKKPPVPVDADEADSAMERFIRSKYMQAASSTAKANGARRHNTASSDEGTPPPLPPKTGSRFFKSAALSFRSKKDPKSSRENSFDGQTLPPRNNSHLPNKPSKVFGASVHTDSPEATAQKLLQLRDMGFVDDKRNAMILKGVNGNLEKTVEALVRLGGGGFPLPATSPRDTMPLSRSLTPQPTSSRTTNGLSKSSPPPARSPATPSNNPWDIQPAQPQSSQSTGTLQNKNPFYASNPFGIPDQQSGFNLNQSLQNLSLAPSQQQLFPHHTGGAPASHPFSQSMYSQPMTPPIPQTQNFAGLAFNNSQTYPQPAPAPQSPQNYNPFLQPPAAPQQPSLSLNTSPFQQIGGMSPHNGNPFTRSPTRIASPTLNQIPEQSQQNVYNTHTPQSPYASNPFLSMPQQQQQQQPMQSPQHQPMQQNWFDNQQQQPIQAAPQPMYQPQRADNASIMALYNYPQLAPNQAQQQHNPNAANTQINSSAAPLFDTSVPPQPSAASTAAGNKNPFLNSAVSPATSPTAAPAFASVSNGAAPGARSRESMTLGMEMSWNNGRHSPDAFASLSARSR